VEGQCLTVRAPSKGKGVEEKSLAQLRRIPEREHETRVFSDSYSLKFPQVEKEKGGRSKRVVWGGGDTALKPKRAVGGAQAREKGLKGWKEKRKLKMKKKKHSTLCLTKGRNKPNAFGKIRPKVGRIGWKPEIGSVEKV